MIAEKNSVLVTGGAGYIGSHVCKSLSESGFLPITYDNLSRGFRWAVKWGPFERGASSDAVRIDEVLDRYSPIVIIHLAGYAYVGESVERPELYHTNNVEGSRVLIDALSEDARIPIPVVFSSSCGIYGDQRAEPLSVSLPARPMNPYAEGKLAVEILLAEAERRTGASFMALRYFNATDADPMGEIGEAHDPETHLIPLALEVAAGLRDEIVVFGTNHDTPDGTCIRDYVHVTDLAVAHVSALEYLLDGGASAVINLANGQGYSVFKVIGAVRRMTHRDVNVRLGQKRPGDPAILVGDAARAAALLNWQPRFSDLDVQIAHAWSWLRSHHELP